MEILVEVKNVYGNELVYPACDKAEIFCKLLQTKTLPAYAIMLIKKLGYAIKVKAPNLEIK